MADRVPGVDAGRDSIGVRPEGSALTFSPVREAPSLLTAPFWAGLNDERAGLTRFFPPEARTDRSAA